MGNDSPTVMIWCLTYISNIKTSNAVSVVNSNINLKNIDLPGWSSPVSADNASVALPVNAGVRQMGCNWLSRYGQTY